MYLLYEYICRGSNKESLQVSDQISSVGSVLALKARGPVFELRIGFMWVSPCDIDIQHIALTVLLGQSKSACNLL